MKIYDIFVGEDIRDAKQTGSWDYGIDQADVVQRIDNVLTQLDINPGDEIVILVRPEGEGE